MDEQDAVTPVTHNEPASSVEYAEAAAAVPTAEPTAGDALTAEGAPAKEAAGTRPYDIDYPEKFKEFMRTGWRDSGLDVSLRVEVPHHAKRRGTGCGNRERASWKRLDPGSFQVRIILCLQSRPHAARALQGARVVGSREPVPVSLTAAAVNIGGKYGRRLLARTRTGSRSLCKLWRKMSAHARALATWSR